MGLMFEKLLDAVNWRGSLPRLRDQHSQEILALLPIAMKDLWHCGCGQADANEPGDVLAPSYGREGSAAKFSAQLPASQ